MYSILYLASNSIFSTGHNIIPMYSTNCELHQSEFEFFETMIFLKELFIKILDIPKF